MMLVPWPVVEACGDVLHRAVLRAGVVLGDPDQRGGQHQADGAGAEQGHRRDRAAGGELEGLREHRRRDEVEGDQRQHAGDGQALVQRRHHVLHARRGLDEEAADDRGDDRDAAEHQRVDDGVDRRAADHQGAERHGRDQRDGVGLEQVGGHAGAVADVVADVVGDHRRVARVVFRNAGLDLAHQVGADVGALGEDAAAQPREDRDQRGAEGEAEQRLEGFRVDLGAAAQIPEEAADAEQAEADDQHAGDRAALEGDVERRADALGGGLRGAHVGAHRDVHADEAAGAGEHGAEHEAGGGEAAEEDRDQDGKHDADDGDGLVLARQVGGRALLDRRGDLLHARVAGVLAEDPASLHEAVDDCGQAAGERDVKRRRGGDQENSFLVRFVRIRAQGSPDSWRGVRNARE